ncbi:MAG: glutamate-1-semialdehyde 2,1-aminomutase [Planctomycetota bacterium]
MRTDESRRLYERACKVIPGGVNSPVRAFRAVGMTPLFIARGEGPYVYDADGNRYIDYVGSWGPLILGHAHGAVVEAVRKAAEKGTSFGAPTELECEMAELIAKAVPSIEKVRMVNSGTEAVMSAVRLARAHTGRDVIIKFRGCYHGHADTLLAASGSGPATFGHPTTPGVPEACARQTLVLPYNDVAAVREAFQIHKGKVAGIIVEPVAGNMGVVAPAAGFLQALRRGCDEAGALLIFDEVITGFRVAFGGAQALFGVKPDLTVLGKIVGGGLPVGAFGGPAEIMDKLSPDGPVYQAGTLSGNPIALAAGLATIRELEKQGTYEILEQRSARLAKGIGRAVEESGAPATLSRVGSMMSLFFAPPPIRDFGDVSKSDTSVFTRYFRALLSRGVYIAPSQFEAAFVSLAHTEEVIDETVARAGEALRELGSC